MSQRMSYDLSEEMLDLLDQEFSGKRQASEYATQVVRAGQEKIEAVARQIFGKYGRNWMSRTMELGERYSDRTYEILKEADRKTGTLTFPHVAQRFLEIAYIGTQPITKLNIVLNTPRQLAYRMESCATFDTLKEKCNEEILRLLPCKYGCLSACETLFEALNLKVELFQEAFMPEEGYCQFIAQKD